MSNQFRFRVTKFEDLANVRVESRENEDGSNFFFPYLSVDIDHNGGCRLVFLKDDERKISFSKSEDLNDFIQILTEVKSICSDIDSYRDGKRFFLDQKLES